MPSFAFVINKFFKMWQSLPSFLRNKYLLALTVFLVWVSFFDEQNAFYHYKRHKELSSLQAQKKYYEQEIIKEKTTLDQLQNNDATVEKMARELYFMKKPNEDIYIELPQKK
jgi:cell division protein DivIC